MFICNDCIRNNYKNATSGASFRSYGLCELCRRTDGCIEIHHSKLLPNTITASDQTDLRINPGIK